MCAAVVAQAGSCTSQRGFPGYRVAFGFPAQGVGYVHPLDLVSVEMVLVSCVSLKPLLCVFNLVVDTSSTDTGDDVCRFSDSVLLLF